MSGGSGQWSGDEKNIQEAGPMGPEAQQLRKVDGGFWTGMGEGKFGALWAGKA